MDSHSGPGDSANGVPGTEGIEIKARTQKWFAFLTGAAIGAVLLVIMPLAQDAVRNWIGQIVLEAIHYHYSWEQAQNRGIMIPACNGGKA